MRYSLVLLLGLVMAWGTGCARYEYDIVQPPEFAGRIGRKVDHTLERDPLEYRLRTVENRLVLRIYNTTDDAIQLLGEQSTVVDSAGESHPLPTQTMAPRSFIKRIIPPPRPRIYRTGPTFGIGVGTRIGRARPGYDDPFYDPWYEPRYFAIYETNVPYWEWRGEGEGRITLVFDRAGKSFTHEFIIRRLKV